jgi:AcrR family transcriptional regulator
LRPCLIIADLSPTEETPVLEEFMGVPTHPLLIHAAVVLVPLLALLAIAYALVPFVRPHTRWVLGLLALAAPVSALLAKLSGDAFFARLRSRGAVTPEFVPTLEAHRRLGTLTLYATIALALLTLALVYFVGPRVAAARAGGGGSGSPRTLSVVLAVLSVVAAAVSLYYVVRTGDSGAKAVWTGS